MSRDSEFPGWHGTTIVSVRKGNRVVIAGDGQVSVGNTVMKHNARKVRRLAGDTVIGGFAGATADAFTLFERLEKKLEQYPNQLMRAAVELAKDWRSDKYLRHLEAMMIVADKTDTLVLTGNGDVLTPDKGVIAIGSGGVSGKGFLQGTQSRLNFLPEKQTDFIWTSFCEEFGFVGALALLILFAVVIFYGLQTAISARSQFDRLLAMGVILNFFFYIMINGAMVMGLIPVVGIPMPLLSYGGSAMLTVMLGFGILMSVHIHRQVEIPRHSGGII